MKETNVVNSRRSCKKNVKIPYRLLRDEKIINKNKLPGRKTA